MWPHVWHMRRWTQRVPSARQSSQPATGSGSSRRSIESRWLQAAKEPWSQATRGFAVLSRTREPGRRRWRSAPGSPAIPRETRWGRRICSRRRGDLSVEREALEVDPSVRPVVEREDVSAGEPEPVVAHVGSQSGPWPPHSMARPRRPPGYPGQALNLVTGLSYPSVPGQNRPYCPAPRMLRTHRTIGMLPRAMESRTCADCPARA